MVASRLGPSGRRPAARPLPGATWQAEVLDANAITREMNRLWSRFGGERRGTRTEPDGESGSGSRPASVLTRASTLNLIAVARSRPHALRIEDAVTHLSDLYPSRATILVANPERPPTTNGGLDVRVALLEQEADKGRPAVRFECVTVEVSAANERYLASIASPLLVVDLPDFLWWADVALADSELFEDLLVVSDRLIVDSSTFADPTRELRHLASLLCRAQGCPKLSDFAWARVGPWRTLITQFFDPAPARSALDAIDEVAIGYERGSDGHGGLTATLLLAGWLGSRLEWQAPGELVPARDEPGAWRATLRAGSSCRRREVLLTIRPSASPTHAECLADVALAAGGGASGSFRIKRVDDLTLATLSETAGMPPVQRMAYAGALDDAALLAEELREFGRDPVFEAALAFAASLAPDEVDTAST